MSYWRIYGELRNLNLTQKGIGIGFIYALQSISCCIASIITLCDTMQEKNPNAPVNGVLLSEKSATIALLACAISLSLTGFLVSLVLIWGCTRRNYLLLTPWLYYAAILMFLNAVYIMILICTLIASAINHTASRYKDSLMWIIVLLIVLILQIVFYRPIKALQNEFIFEHDVNLPSAESTQHIMQHEEPTDRN